MIIFLSSFKRTLFFTFYYVLVFSNTGWKCGKSAQQGMQSSSQEGGESKTIKGDFLSKKNLTPHLDLRAKQIGDQEAIELAKILESHYALNVLRLGDN